MSSGIITFDVSAYKLTVLTISPTEITELQVGTSQQLLVEATPQDVDTQLTWTSSDATVATVTNEGLVTGVNAGTCVITVKDVDGVQATCNVTVKESPVYSIADFKKLETGSKSFLQLTDAEVLAVCQTTAYVRDASGCIMLANMDLNLMQNDRVSGKLMAQANVSNNMPQALGTETTSASALTITAGSEVNPREVTLADLTEADYSDYVLVKAAKLMKDNGAWAVDDEGNKIARLNNTLQILDITLSNYDGKYYDIPAIYGTNVLNNEIINELYMLASPTLVEEPSGIMEISASTQHATTFYNLNGQRVGSNYKGIIIINGKKMMKK